MPIPNKIGLLNQPQDKINRQFYKMLCDAEAGDASAIAAIQEAIGDESTAKTILKRIKDLETIIGDESTKGSLLYRTKALEDAG